jgi:alpha-aminoadipate carrier protein LysW
MATCPECDAEIEIDDDDLEEMQIGDPWVCDDCGSALRVAIVAPLEFDVDDDEDEDDEEEDEEKEKVEGDEELEDDDADDDDADDGNWDE